MANTTNNTASGMILAKDFNPALLNFEAVPSRNSMGGKFIRLSYGPRKLPLKIQTPTVYMPFGISSFTDADKGTTTESLDISLRGHEEEDCPVFALHKALKAIDGAVLAAATEHSEAWFGKKMTRAILEEFQRPLVRLSNDPTKYAPTFKSKIIKDFRTGLPPKVYDVADRSTVQDISYIVKGSSGKLLVTFPSIYLISKTFGISPRLVQVVIVSRPVQDEGCQLLDDEEDDCAVAAAKGADAAPAGGATVDEDDMF